MSKEEKNKSQQQEEETLEENVTREEAQEIEAEDVPEQEAEAQPEGEDQTPLTPEEEIEKLKAEIEKQKNDYLFLMADFENFRRRTLQEKQDLVKNGGERVLKGILPVVDDMERAIDAIEKGGDLDSLKEGVDIIYNELMKFLKSNNVEPIESTGQLFDTDLHDAVTTFPAPSEDMKGKVIDTTIKGYKINDKVLRHAKVVVGS